MQSLNEYHLRNPLMVLFYSDFFTDETLKLGGCTVFLHEKSIPFLHCYDFVRNFRFMQDAIGEHHTSDVYKMLNENFGKIILVLD